MNTPIYDAICTTMADFINLNAQVSGMMEAIQSEHPEQRERMLNQWLFDHADDNEAAQYFIRTLNLYPNYDSRKCAFASYRQTLICCDKLGKKKTITNLTLKGVPSGIGDCNSVVAMDDGYVVDAGKCCDTRSRVYHQMLHVTIATGNSIQVRYNRLGGISVSAGEKVCKGQPIGMSGKNGCIEIDVRRNGRRIDAAEWLGIEVKR